MKVIKVNPSAGSNMKRGIPNDCITETLQRIQSILQRLVPLTQPVIGLCLPDHTGVSSGCYTSRVPTKDG